MSRLIAVGDIHGCSEALKTLVEAIQPAAEDVIVTLGDYVDRGPDSRGVIDQLLQLQQQCQLIPLIGNHEMLMLNARADARQFDFWSFCGGNATLASYGGDLDGVPAAHWAFIEQCQRYHEADDCFFIHANYIWKLPLDQQPEDVALWTHLSQQSPPPHMSGKLAVVGHTPQPGRQVRDLPHLLCIDTCCFAEDGCLTACEIGSRTYWQADRDGNLL